MATMRKGEMADDLQTDVLDDQNSIKNEPLTS